MPRKSFEAGMEAGAKPFEEKFKKQADAIEKVGQRMDSRLDEISGVMDVMMDDLSAQERKRVYDLNTVIDISELDDTEKEYLCSIVYAIASLNSQLTQEQKDYLRSLKSYLKIINVQSDVNLASIENIDNITTQKAIMQTIMEFLFLEYGNHDYMDDYEDVFDYFSVNRKGVREIQDGIDAMYETVGLEGLVEHYGSTKKVTIVQGSGLSKADLDLRAKAEAAYLKYDIKSAFPLFNLLSEQGDGRSCYFLGQIYECGYQGVVKIDEEQAKAFRQKGADVGDLLCKMKLADSIDDKNEKQIIYANTYEAVLALAEDGDIYAMSEIARIFDFAYDSILDKEKAIYWYKIAADAGFWEATIGLGKIYYDEKKYTDAFTMFSNIYNANCEQVCFYLAECYYYGNGVEKNIKTAKKLYAEAEKSGLKGANKKLGYMAMVEAENAIASAIWYTAKMRFTLAVDEGDMDALYDLAVATKYSYGSSYKDELEEDQTL